MDSGYLSNNLALLEKRDPKLASRLRSLKLTGEYIAAPSRSGPVGLTHVLPDGSRKTLHSAFDPVLEAVKYIDSLKQEDTDNYVVTGMGLGYHILEILRRAPPTSRILVIEKNPELCLLALTHHDFTALLNNPRATIHVGIDPGDLQHILSADKTQFALNGYTIVAFKTLVNAEIAYYHAINKTLESMVQEYRIDFNTQSAFSRPFYENIMGNLPAILGSIGIKPLKDRMHGIPAVIVSAGPSLDKNIHLLRNLDGKAVLIAVATALRPLLSNHIEPDFVVAIDPDEALLKAFNLEDPPGKTWLLYDPCVIPLIPKCFESKKITYDSNVFLSQWISRHNGEKGSLGKTRSVAHTAMKFAQHLGCAPIMLAGQDLAFNDYRMHCRGSYFHEALEDTLNWLTTMNYLQKENYRIYSKALVTAPDVFGYPATTTTAMNSYNHLFAEEINGDLKVVNGTEGGIPIRGVQNHCLRELLNNHCRKNIETIRQFFIGESRIETHVNSLVTALLSQAKLFQQLHDNLSDLAHRHIKNKNVNTDQAEFVQEMERHYKSLLQDEDTLQLLQGYAYPEFLQWNKSNHEIKVNTHSYPTDKLLTLKFKRDKQFIETLIDTSDYLGKAFAKMARQAAQYSQSDNTTPPTTF